MNRRLDVGAITAVVIALVLAVGLPTTSATWSVLTANDGNQWSTGSHWPGSQTFEYTGDVQSFNVPPGYDHITIEAWGAQGGGNAGGRGGYARATVPVTAGEQFRVHVGGRPSGSAAGFNGGGQGGSQRVDPAAGGGGASDVRRGGERDLDTRLVVAAGGGGESGRGNAGGAGGGLTGGNGAGSGQRGGGGGSQSAGGRAGSAVLTSGDNGSLGQGGAGARGTNFVCPSGGGGGGGYFGGGGGACAAGGGGGGSSFAAPRGATDTGTDAGVRTGHGRVVIHWG